VLKFKAVIITFFLLAISVFSQKKPVITLDENDGLCENQVREIFMDRNSILWIGTDNGLSRYDGNRFRNYHKTEGLAGNMIWGLAADRDNRIYAGCYTVGLSLLEEGEVTRSWRFPEYAQNTIQKLLYDNACGCLVVGTDYGIYLFKDSLLYPVQYPYPPGKRKSSIISLKKYKGRIFFTVHGYKGSVYELKIDPDSLTASRVVQIGPEESMLALTFYHDTVFSNHYNELYACSMRGGPPVLYARARSDFLAWDMVTLPANWIIAGGYRVSSFGVNARLFDAGRKVFFDVPWLLQTSSVTAFRYDTLRKIVWAATANGIKALVNTPFSYYDLDIGDIIDLTYHNGSLYILTDAGIYLLNDGRVEMVKRRETINRAIKKKRMAYYTKNHRDPFGTDRRISINYNYFITDGDRVFLNTNLGSVSIPGLSAYLPFEEGHFITKGNAGYYVRSYGYLCYYHDLGNIFKNADSLGRELGGIRDISDVRETGGVYYFSSYFNGLYAVSGNKSWNLNENNSEIDNFLSSMDVDKEGNVWVVSPNGNLFEIGFNDSLILKKKINRYNSEILGESYKWLKFNNGFLYLATDKGLNILSEEAVLKGEINTLWFYNHYNGYLDISTSGPVVADRGYLFVHTQKGLVRIGMPVHRKKHGAIRVRELIVDGRDMGIGSLDGRRLPASTKDISMTFFLLDYPTDRNVEYRYHVNEGKWARTNVISLPFLKPGRYTMTMEARDLETDQIYRRTVKFLIMKPVWSQWWSLVLITVIVLWSIYLLLRIRYERLRKKEEIRNRMIRESAELQIKALQLQMSPHFIFNTLNTIQAAVMNKSKEDTLDFIGDLSLVIRENLESVSEDYIPLSREITFLQRYAGVERFRLGEKIKIDFIISVEDTERLLVPPMLIQPLLENSIKHGLLPRKEGGEIEVKIDQELEYLLVTVRDNGIGRARARELAEAKKHQSKGIDLLKKRLDYLNLKNKTNAFRIVYEDLFEEGHPAGTVVRLYLQIIWRKDQQQKL